LLKYDNTVSSTATGQPIYGAQVSVYEIDANGNNGATASLYADEAGTTPLSQPLLTDQAGYFAFYIGDGKYNISVMTGPVEISRTNITMVDSLQLKQRALLVPINEDSGVLPGADARKGMLLAFDRQSGAPTAVEPDTLAGPTGPANSTYTSIESLRAAPATNQSYILTTPAGPRTYNFVQGDFSALIMPSTFMVYDFVALNSVPASQGALVLDRGTQRTLADFGAVGDFVANDTAAVQAAANWSGITQREVLAVGTKGWRFEIDKLTIRTTMQMRGMHRRLCVFRPRKLASPPSDYYGLFEIDAGPVIECKFRDFRIDGLLSDGTANPRQIGLYAFARRPADSAAFPQGGLWYSDFTRVDIANFESHSAWFRGGTVDNPSNPGTYSFLLPNQFLNFFQCDWVRGGAAGATAAVLSGQCGQFLFKKCAFGGSGLTGYSVGIGREYVGGSREQNLVSGAGLFAGAFVAPGAIYYEQCTFQGAFTGILTDQANVIVRSNDFETLRRALTFYGGNVEVNGNEFRNAGDFGGNGWAVGSFNANVSGKGNIYGGITDRIWMKDQPHTSRFDLEMVGPYTAGQTVGTWLNTGVQADGTIDLGSSRLCRIDGNPTGCVNMTSGMLPGEYQDMYVTPDTGPLAILSSGTLEVPGGRLVLRGGDTLRVTRNDQINKFIFAATIGELRGGQMPTTGRYYEGEFVRNVNSGSIFSGPGVTLGWYRLTTGTSHVAGTDWRTLQVTGA